MTEGPAQDLQWEKPAGRTQPEVEEGLIAGRVTEGSGGGAKTALGREGVEGLTSAAEPKANGEKVKLVGDLGSGEGKMGPEGLNARGERLKLRCVRMVGCGQIGAVGLKAKGERVKFAGGMRGEMSEGDRTYCRPTGKELN